VAPWVWFQAGGRARAAADCAAAVSECAVGVESVGRIGLSFLVHCGGLLLWRRRACSSTTWAVGLSSPNLLSLFLSISLSFSLSISISLSGLFGLFREQPKEDKHQILDPEN
jgi:hypothetical protein